MPKSAKKRRDKAADFSKAKLKLGKGKQLANNAIDTSFKARSIALPTQSIAIEKDDAAPTTRRRLTFEDLIAHIKHHNVGARKDALLGLRELLEAHPELIESSLTTLINACVRIIADDDASVRKTLLSFLSWLLPRIPTENLIPHSPLLILFTTSAQTHIFPEIRIDAIRFLDLFLEIIPETLTAGWTEGSGHGNRILEGYLGILNAGTKFGEADGPLQPTSTASVVLSSASKLIVLRSLSHFLKSALNSSSRNINSPPNPFDIPLPTWYLTSSFASSEAYTAFDSLLHPVLCSSGSTSTSRDWKPEIELESSDEDFTQNCVFATGSLSTLWNLQELSEVAGLQPEVNSSKSAGVIFIVHLARTLQSTLISTFLDCAPTVFSPTSDPPGSELQLILAVAVISRSLYGAIFQDSTSDEHNAARDNLKALLGYMTTYFPFRPNNIIIRDAKIEQSFQDLNLIYCELTSLLVLASHKPPLNTLRTNRGKSRHVQKTSQASEGVLSIQAERVSEYVVKLLRGEPSSGMQLGRPLTPEAYIALLPSIWSLLNQPSLNEKEMSAEVLQATLEHATKASPKSAVKKAAIEFVARLALLETELRYQGSFKLGKTAHEIKQFEEWLVHLPQILWELGSNNLSTTEIILRCLLRLFQRQSPLVNSEITKSVRSRFVPYFSITHPIRGQIPGPYTKLPTASPLRRLVLDVVAVTLMVPADGSQHAGLIAAILTATSGTAEAEYWSHLESVFRY